MRRLSLTAAALALLIGAGPAAAECKLLKLAELPVAMTGMAPVVTTQIDGHDALLVADSGASFSMLSPAAAARLGLKVGWPPPGFFLRGVGGTEDVKVAHAQDFALAGHHVKQAIFLVGAGVSGRADGLLGGNILNYLDVEYDLANGVIRLFQSEDCGGKSLAYWAGDRPYSVVDVDPVTFRSRKIRSSAKLNGQDIKVIFDTGASLSILTTQAAARAGVRRDSADVAPAGLSGGIGQRAVDTWIAPFDSFAIGDEQIRNTRLRIGDMSLLEARGPDLDMGAAQIHNTRLRVPDLVASDMLLGADFFLSHRILVSFSQHKLYFTYNGGPVFRLDQAPAEPLTATGTEPPSPAAEPSGEEPKDADGYTRRGGAFMARRDFAHAIADFSRAAELDPNEPRRFYDRGLAHAANSQPYLAMADFDQALKLKPDYVEALMERGRMRLAGRDLAGAQQDFDAAARVDPGSRLAIARAYERAGLNDAVLVQLDLWIADHPKDEVLPFALAERCRGRVLVNRELDKAVADCDEALKLKPHTSTFLDSRGLAHLRLGQLDAAIADFDAALKLQPKGPWSLYGRGVAETKKGDKAKGDADIQAAAAIAPRLPDDAKRLGLTP
jgi:tetratricopeptide (TPR) repeat protein